MQGDLIQHALASRAEFELLSRIDSLAEAPEHLLRQQQPDLVIVGLRHGEDEGVAQAIHDLAPRVLVVTIASDLRSASVHRLGYQPHDISGLSEDSLVAEIFRLIART
jgi:DNA-binding NarL/FixJ family response regulator